MSRQEYPNAVEVSVIFHEGMKMFAVPKQLAPVPWSQALEDVRYLLEGRQPPFWANTTPQPAQRTWVGLTDDDKCKIELEAGITEDDDGYIVSQIFRLIDDKLRSKNT